MRINISLLAIAVAVLLLLGYTSLFTVHQTEYALKLRFGKVVSADYEPGLQLKWPLLDKIHKFERRILTLDADAEHFLTGEKKNVIVDSYIKWHIIEPMKYFTDLGGNESRAGQRLGEIVAGGLRNKFGSRTIQEVVSGDRAEIMTSITEEANLAVKPFGIEVVDVRIKRIDLPKEVSASVYRRMEAERERVARELRSRGEAAALRIRADADRQRVELLAQAERDADTIRGEGEATAANLYAEAFTRDPEFYSLYRSLGAYRETFDSRSDMLVLEPDSEFFKYFKQPIIPGSPSASASPGSAAAFQPGGGQGGQP